MRLAGYKQTHVYAIHKKNDIHIKYLISFSYMSPLQTHTIQNINIVSKFFYQLHNGLNIKMILSITASNLILASNIGRFLFLTHNIDRLQKLHGPFMNIPTR